MFAPTPFSLALSYNRLVLASLSFWRHSPMLVLDACRKRVKIDFVAGPALWMILSFWQAYFV